MGSASCIKCHRSFPEVTGTLKPGLRRGLCRACYLRAWRGAELPADAHCTLCPERRHTVLRWTKLDEAKIITCQNCGFIADKMRPRPRTREELLEFIARERRAAPLGERRRNYIIDPEDPAERRTQSRRRGRRRMSAS